MKNKSEGKKVTDSMVKSAELMQPNDANHLGNVFGGKVLSMIDLSGAISAMRHCRKIVVTASVDRVDFKHPIKVGHFAIIKARLNAAFKTSVEVQVEIYSEHPITGERLHTCSALVTYVALNEKGRPAPIPALVCTTPEEEEMHRLAEERKGIRDKARRRDLGQRGPNQ
jgi:acyl-CoA hydrolase